MTIRPDGRRIVSVTMRQSLYDRLKAACDAADQPVTVVARAAIMDWLERREKKAEP